MPLLLAKGEGNKYGRNLTNTVRMEHLGGILVVQKTDRGLLSATVPEQCKITDFLSSGSSAHHQSDLQRIGFQFVHHDTLPSHYPCNLDHLPPGRDRSDERTRKAPAPLLAAWTHSWTVSEAQKVSASRESQQNSNMTNKHSQGSSTI